jgi:hypothetical protein
MCKHHNSRAEARAQFFRERDAAAHRSMIQRNCSGVRVSAIVRACANRQLRERRRGVR